LFLNKKKHNIIWDVIGEYFSVLPNELGKNSVPSLRIFGKKMYLNLT